MFRFALLIVLPLVAHCQLSPEQQREQTLKHLEEHAKPCIMHDLDCPKDGSWDFSNYAVNIRHLMQYSVPDECKCDFNTETCNRMCFYAFYVKRAQIGATEGKTNATEIAKVKNETREQMEQHYKPCIIENKNCEMLGGLDYSQIVAQVTMYVQMYSLPDECQCDGNSDNCVRLCFYSNLKKNTLAALPTEQGKA